MISFFVLRYSRLLKKNISFSAEKQTNHYVFRQKKSGGQPSSRDWNGSKSIQVSDATKATVEKHLTFTWDIGSSCGFTPLDRLADGCLAGTRKPLMSQWSRENWVDVMSFFRLKCQFVVYKCIRWLICKRILKFWSYDETTFLGPHCL